MSRPTLSRTAAADRVCIHRPRATVGLGRVAGDRGFAPAGLSSLIGRLTGRMVGSMAPCLKPILSIAPVLVALCACAQLGGPTGEREQAFDRFVAAEDEARHQLRLFQEEPRRTCASEHLAKASAGADANLVLLVPSGQSERSRPIDPSVVHLVETTYGSRPVQDVASLTLDVANEAAEAGCADQARVLYRDVLDRYVGSDYIDDRQRAELGLAQIGDR